MIRSRLLLGVGSVLAGTTVLFVVFGLVYSPILLLAALPFGAATYLLWSHGTGRLEAQMRGRARVGPGFGPAADATRGPTRSGPGPRWSNRQGEPGGRYATGPGWGRTGPDDRSGRGVDGARSDRADAARVLGVAPDADAATVRRAFREKARDVHPDAPGGDEVAFKRVRSAYETLTNGR